jgi:predicted nucleic acid-binding protein
LSYLLDTCLVSEVWKPSPNAGVVRWLEDSFEGELHVVDGLLAATALVHGFTLVTRNVEDFGATPVPVVNPWV